jgi:hypothetical protein
VVALWLLACSPRATTRELVWVQQIGADFHDTVAGVDIASDGDILVGGGFGQTVEFGVDAEGNPVKRTACGNNYYDDAFVAKYAPDGTVRWVATLSSCDMSRTQAIAATPTGGVVAAGFFNHSLEVDGVVLVNAGARELASQGWVASWSAAGDLEWIAAGYAENFDATGVATSPDGTVFVAGSTVAVAELQFTNGLHAPTRFPTDLYQAGTDSFLAAFEADGSGRWLRMFGTAGRDTPGEVAVSGDVVAVAHWPTSGPMVFEPDRPDGTMQSTGSSISTWDAEGGRFRSATGIGEPTSSLTVGVAAAGDDLLVSVTLGVANRNYGSSGLTWRAPPAHGLVTTWTTGTLEWNANALLDSTPPAATGSVEAHWIDARSDGWSVLSGYLGGEVVLATVPPRAIRGPANGGDGFVGLLSPDLRLAWATWMPGPQVEEVRAALAPDGAIAVVGSFQQSITLEPGTDRETTLSGDNDAFVAYFAPGGAE